MGVFDSVKNKVILYAMSAYGSMCRKTYLKKSRNADQVTEKMFKRIIRGNQHTEFGRRYDFAHIRTIEDYRRKVPYTTYEDYREYLERTSETGEQNLITSERIDFLAKTSGTTGVTKLIPVVNTSYKPYVKCASIFIRILTEQLKKRGIPAGKGLNTIETECHISKGGVREGFISAYALSSAKMVIPAITCLPKEVFGYGDDVDMKYIKARYAMQDKHLVYIMSVFMSTLTDLVKYMMDNHQMLINDIRTGTIDPEVKLDPVLREKLEKKLRPDPQRADELKDIFMQGTDQLIVSRLWPDMSVIIAIGTGEFTPFTEKMRTFCEKDVVFCYEMYAASEALVASAMEAENKDYLLIPDGGFFEFLPVDQEEPQPLLPHELKVGELYEIVVTSLSGLYRYRIKDVIRVTGFEGKNPLVQFGYRKEQLINITGVKLTIEHITNAIKGFEKQSGVQVLDYSLYTDTDFAPWRIVAFMELDGEVPKAKEDCLREILDEELTKVNPEYGRMLKIGECSPSVICQVKKNTYRQFRMQKVQNGASDNQVKTIRFIDSEEKYEFFKAAVIQSYH